MTMVCFAPVHAVGAWWARRIVDKLDLFKSSRQGGACPDPPAVVAGAAKPSQLIVIKELIVNCIHCATSARGEATTAVAVCADCGAGACHDHARVVTVPAGQGGLVPARPAVRRILCASC